MEKYVTKLRAILKRRSFKYGVPFLALMLGGSFGLKEFAQLRYTFSRNSSISQADFELNGIEKKQPSEVTLESEFEKIQALDIDNWEQKRGPRPWEEGAKP